MSRDIARGCVQEINSFATRKSSGGIIEGLVTWDISRAACSPPMIGSLDTDGEGMDRMAYPADG
jgi:hypothetical protein